MTTVKDIGELELIARLTGGLAQRGDVAVGAGDDCAVVTMGADTDLVLTSDPVISGVHFLPNAESELIGRKALGRALSDIAAMGAEPRWALINLVAPPDTPVELIEDIYRGINDLAAEFSVAIAGGDVASGKTLELHLFGVGSLPHGSARLRSGAKAGDIVYVTGELGGSLISGKHLNVHPRIREGIMLRDWATAMIDVSDGLASEARHIAQMSGVGICLNEESIPISEVAVNADDGTTPLNHALCDGEDFELLFTIPESRQQEFEAAWLFHLKCSPIGKVTSTGCDVSLQDPNGVVRPIAERLGFTHFRSTPADNAPGHPYSSE